jgi:DNA-binding GntR family transcriptional regulator
MQAFAAKNRLAPDIARERARKRAYTAILAKIVSGELAPGQRLREEELAQTYKVSRTPIREILIALEKDGLIQRNRNQGAKVISFTPDDLEELYDVRCALECLAVRRAVPHMPLNELLEFEQRLAALLRDGGGPRLLQRQSELDLELHRFIVSQSGNRRLIAYLENVSLLPQSLRLAGYDDEEHAREVGQEHLMLVRALLRRDSQLAERLLARHIENGKSKMLELLYQRREVCGKLA